MVVSVSIRSTRAWGHRSRSTSSTRWVPSPLYFMNWLPQAGQVRGTGAM